MEKYLVICEPIETKTKDVISEAFEQGLQNGYFEAVEETESLDEARKILAKNLINVRRISAPVKRYSADLYYLVKVEWDEYIEDWETDLDSLEFAEVTEGNEEEGEE